MSTAEPIRVNVDPTNPGQFFACCGLLEMADRCWGRAEGWFSHIGTSFHLRRTCNASDGDGKDLIAKLASCVISSTMADEQIQRLKRLLNQKKTTLTAHDAAEKQQLTDLWNKERIRFCEPFDLWIDWWGDKRAGGNSFKTWAGKQFAIDLLRGMQASIRSASWQSLGTEKWLNEPTLDGSLPLYFDSDIGGQASSIDVGFSLDALDMRSRTKPLIELAAFIGLQRFRPLPDRSGESFMYMLWTYPLPPILAALACCGTLPQQLARNFEFRLLYRTKYLKSFLPARPKGG